MIDAAALARWLGAGAVEVAGRPTGGGWSNDTVFVRADGRALVVRLTPPGRSMFPDYDLGHQVRAMGYAAAGGVPVPEVVGYEPDPAVLGRPFFVMARVDGRVPADDDPPFTKAGFLFDADPADQRSFHDAAVDAIVGVQRLAPPPFAVVGPSPAAHLAACRALEQWCELRPDVLDAAHARLAAELPDDDPAHHRFLWGDARPANMVVAEGHPGGAVVAEGHPGGAVVAEGHPGGAGEGRFAIVSLLDWELACAGPGELDVAWFLEMNHMRSVGMGVPMLAGFPDDEGTWARWSAAVGRRPMAVGWHRLFAAYRVAAFMQLYMAKMLERGVIPAGHRALLDNPGTRRLTQLLA